MTQTIFAGMDESERVRFELELYTSPEGEVTEGAWSDEAMAEGFEAFMREAG